MGNTCCKRKIKQIKKIEPLKEIIHTSFTDNFNWPQQRNYWKTLNTEQKKDCLKLYYQCSIALNIYILLEESGFNSNRYLIAEKCEHCSLR